MIEAKGGMVEITRESADRKELYRGLVMAILALCDGWPVLETQAMFGACVSAATTVMGRYLNPEDFEAAASEAAGEMVSGARQMVSGRAAREGSEGVRH